MKTIKRNLILSLLLLFLGLTVIDFQGMAQCNPPTPTISGQTIFTICQNESLPNVRAVFSTSSSGCTPDMLTVKLFKNGSFEEEIEFIRPFPDAVDLITANVGPGDYIVQPGQTADLALYLCDGGNCGTPVTFEVTRQAFKDSDFSIYYSDENITDGTANLCSGSNPNFVITQNESLSGTFTWRNPLGSVIGSGSQFTITNPTQGTYSVTFVTSGCTINTNVSHNFTLNLNEPIDPIVLNPDGTINTCEYSDESLWVDIGTNVITNISYEWRIYNSLAEDGIIIGSNSQGISVPPSATNRYVRCMISGMFNSCPERQTIASSPVYLNVVEGLNLSSSDIYIVNSCGSSTVRKRTNNLNWYWQTDPTQRSLSNNLPTYKFYTAGTVWLISNENGCWGIPYQIDVTVPSLNIAPNKPTFRYDNGIYTLIKGIQNSSYDYFWQSSPSGTELEGDEEFEVPTAKTYYLRAKRKDGGCWLGSVKIELPDFSPTNLTTPITRSNTNRFTTYTYQTTASIPDRDNTSPEQVLVNNSYHDGLGRILQRVDKQASPMRRDMVMAYEYDELGRAARQYLPFESMANNGDPVGQPYLDQKVFYENTQGVAYSEMPFSLASFESSPLDRVREYASPGEDWVGNIESVDAKSIKTQYYTNSNAEVIKWEIGSTIPNKQYDYPTNQLNKTITTDEEGNQVIAFSDKFGQIILKRVQSDESATEWADTYYLYDHFGNLLHVLPPMAVVNISEYLVGTNAQKTEFLDKWAFQYKYDSRRRLVEKRIPGADWIYMVYDKRDRLVLTQDGNQRNTMVTSGEEWTFTKYDQLNRPIMTGIYSNGDSRSSVQNLVDSHGIFYESRNAGTTYGYTQLSFPNSGIQNYLSITYYDDYNFLSQVGFGADFAYDPGQITESVTVPQGIYDFPNEAFDQVKGLVTGTMIRILGSDEWLHSVNYYDYKYRAIQTIVHNYRRGIDKMSYLYNFPGWLLKSKTSHEFPGKELLAVERRFEYDHTGRLIRGFHELFKGDISQGEVLLAENKFNALGELVEKNLHVEAGVPHQSIDYRYNIRGWLETINTSDLELLDGVNIDDPTPDLFGMEIIYNNSILGVDPK